MSGLFLAAPPRARPRLTTFVATLAVAAFLAVPAASAQDERACDLLTPELLFDTLGVEADDHDRGVYDEPTYWACAYTWEQDGAASQVTFAISKVENQTAAEVYRTSTEGLTQSGEHQELDDLGDRAVWIPGVPQLSVQSGDHVFHLSVVHPGGDGLETTRGLARQLLERMD